MTPLLAGAAEAPWLTAEELIDGRDHLVVVAPHPDDETLGCGALLRDLQRAGTGVSVVCVTDGSASHPGSRAWPPDRVGQTRKAELEAALAHLAPGAPCHWLGYRDCGLPEAGPDFDSAMERLAACLPPGAAVAVTWAHDPHVDHERTAALVGAVASVRPDLRVLSYPIWGRFGPAAAPAGLVRVRASEAAREAKRAALACHRTQMTHLIDDDPDGFVMDAAHQAHFLETPELFVAA